MVNLEVPISWQAQHLVNLEVQIYADFFLAGTALGGENRSADFSAGTALGEPRSAFSPMRSEGFSFNSWGSGGRALFAIRCFYVRNRSQPFAVER